jgi:ATP-dependent Clp protease ATP-binding subunit ClpA
MFERFTDKAMKVIILAQEEACRLGHQYVGTEQILLGLIGEGTGTAAKLLKSMGVNLKAARIEVEKIIGRGRGSAGVEIPFTEPAKRLLEASWREASNLGVNYIGTEHLLLGLITNDNNQDHGIAVLENSGINPSKLREQILKALSQDKATDRPEIQQSARLPRYGSESAATVGFCDLLKRAVKDLKPQKESAINNQQFELAKYLSEAENQFLEKIREMEPEWTIPETEDVTEAIENGLKSIQKAKEIAIRALQFDLAAWLRESEIQLTAKLQQLRQARQNSGAAQLDFDNASELVVASFTEPIVEGPIRAEEFTPKATKAIMLAQEEARRAGHSFVGTEQILLGLISEGTGIAAKALKVMGVNLRDTRVEVEKIIGRGSGFLGEILPYSPRAKRVLELSRVQAREIGHNYIGTEHLLLGLVREGNGIGARVLENLGIELTKVRSQVLRLLGESHRP